MVDLLFQFAVEFVRALLVDELSDRVRRRASRWFVRRTGSGCRKFILHVHRRNRDRLLNRLLTEIGRDP
jgi:hypothetical protein